MSKRVDPSVKTDILRQAFDVERKLGDIKHELEETVKAGRVPSTSLAALVQETANQYLNVARGFDPHDPETARLLFHQAMILSSHSGRIYDSNFHDKALAGYWPMATLSPLEVLQAGIRFLAE